MAVNNAWSLVRPHLWMSVDTPGSFLDTGWMDGGILKIVPGAAANRRIVVRDEKGIKREGPLVQHCPGVVHFVRDDTFDHTEFFEGNLCSWGSMGREPDSLGLKGTRSVMLCALKVAWWLGFGPVYLLGCDFKMPTIGAPYAFDQDKSESGRASNNHAYRVHAKRLESLKLPSGFEVFNCNPDSGLKCFPHVPMEEAIEKHRMDHEWRLKTEGWYK